MNLLPPFSPPFCLLREVLRGAEGKVASDEQETKQTSLATQRCRQFASLACSDSRDDLLGAIVKIVGEDALDVGVLHQFHRSLNVVALQTNHKRHLRGASPHLLCCVQDTLSVSNVRVRFGLTPEP